MIDIGLPGALKKALDPGNPKARQQKKAEKLKEIDRQLKELVMESKENPGIQDTVAGPARRPFTAIALAVGRMFRPEKNESRMIDEQLSRVIAESGGIDEPPQAATAPGDDAGGRQEISEKVNEVKADTMKIDGLAIGSTANADKMKKPAEPAIVQQSEAPDGQPEAAAKPGPINLRDELLSKLAETAKVEKDVALDIMRDMKGRKVNCDELQGDLLEISILLKKSSKGKQKKSGG